MIIVKIDNKHQLFFDRKNQLYVINKYPILKSKTVNSNSKQPETIIHIHLGTDQPGKINQEELDNIQDLS